MDLFIGQLLAVEIAHHELVVGFGDGVEPEGAALGHVFGDFGRDVLVEEDVHDPAEIRLLPDRPVKRDDDVFAVVAAHLLERRLEIGAFAVEPVHDAEPGNAALLRELPRARRADLGAVDRVDHDQRGVGFADRRDIFADELPVARRVDEEIFVALPFAVHDRGIDARAFFLFIGHEVGNRIFCVDAARPRNGSALEEHELAERGFSAAGVSGDDEVSALGCFGHRSPSLLKVRFMNP